jgi:hypothetical protein
MNKSDRRPEPDNIFAPPAGHSVGNFNVDYNQLNDAEKLRHDLVPYELRTHFALGLLLLQGSALIYASIVYVFIVSFIGLPFFTLGMLVCIYSFPARSFRPWTRRPMVAFSVLFALAWPAAAYLAILPKQQIPYRNLYLLGSTAGIPLSILTTFILTSSPVRKIFSASYKDATNYAPHLRYKRFLFIGPGQVICRNDSARRP